MRDGRKNAKEHQRPPKNTTKEHHNRTPENTNITPKNSKEHHQRSLKTPKNIKEQKRTPPHHQRTPQTPKNTKGERRRGPRTRILKVGGNTALCMMTRCINTKLWRLQNHRPCITGVCASLPVSASP